MAAQNTQQELTAAAAAAAGGGTPGGEAPTDNAFLALYQSTAGGGPPAPIDEHPADVPPGSDGEEEGQNDDQEHADRQATVEAIGVLTITKMVEALRDETSELSTALGAIITKSAERNHGALLAGVRTAITALDNRLSSFEKGMAVAVGELANLLKQVAARSNVTATPARTPDTAATARGFADRPTVTTEKRGEGPAKEDKSAPSVMEASLLAFMNPTSSEKKPGGSGR